jgi:hypothetical protein
LRIIAVAKSQLTELTTRAVALDFRGESDAQYHRVSREWIENHVDAALPEYRAALDASTSSDDRFYLELCLQAIEKRRAATRE